MANAVTHDVIGYVLRYGKVDFLAAGEVPSGFSIVPLDDDAALADPVVHHNGVAAGSFTVLSGPNQALADADYTDELSVGEDGEVVVYDGTGGTRGDQIRPTEIANIGVIGDPNGLVTDGGGGTVDVTAHTGMFRATASLTADIQRVSVPAITGLAIPLDTRRFVGVDYNAGSPIGLVATDDTGFNLLTQYPLAIVSRDSEGIHITPLVIPLTEFASLTLARMYSTHPVDYDEGLQLQTSGGGNDKVTVTAGALWVLLLRKEYFGPGGPFVDFDTNVADTFDSHTGSTGTFGLSANQTDYALNTYNDGSATPATLTNNRYGTRWFYLDPGTGDVHEFLGTSNEQSLAGAEAERAPTDLPPRLQSTFLIGRMIVLKGVAPPAIIETVAPGNSLTPSSPVSHGDLDDLDVDDHSALYPLISGVRGFTHSSGDATAILPFDTSGGSNGAVGTLRLGTRDPNTNITGDPGSWYWRVNGVDSGFYLHIGAAASNSDWLKLGEGGGSVNSSVALPVAAPHKVQSNTGLIFVVPTARNIVDLLVQSFAVTDGAGGSFTFEVFKGADLSTLSSVGSVTVLQGAERGTNVLGAPVAVAAGDLITVDTTAIGAFPIATDIRHQKFSVHVRMTP